MTQHVLIRPVELKDAKDINVLRRMPGVGENLLALPSESISSNEKFITQQTANDHLFCAEINHDQGAMIIGIAGLHVGKMARQSHSAVIGIMVHKDFHGKGVGNKLMESITDLADNWLLLKRLELTVYPDNHAAIKLYEKFGFKHEGVKKYASVRHGKYADVLMMGRYHEFEARNA